MVCTPDALDQSLDVFWSPNLDHKVHIAPVDAQIKAAGTYDSAQVSAHHGGFDPLALDPVQAAVVDADWQAVVIGKPQFMKENLGLRTSIVKNQCGFMLCYLGHYCRYRIGCSATRPRRWCLNL